MSRFTTSDGISLYYEDEGEGLPLLCLAGLTRTARDFDYVAPHLEDVRMIRLDARGRGQSDRADFSTYALPVECRDTVELLDHLGLDRVAVLGTSRGGLQAMSLGQAVPERLMGVALNDIGPEIDESGLDFIMGYLGKNPASRSHDEAAEVLAQNMDGFIGVPTERWLQEARTHFRAGEAGLEITYDPKLRDAAEAVGHKVSPDLWPLFEALPKPLALIWGENSNLLTEATVEEMQRRRPDMMLARVPGRGHIPFLDEPEALEVLKKWLDLMR
jgi:pimeloyl-ACP methyl ester carboxylesterase